MLCRQRQQTTLRHKVSAGGDNSAAIRAGTWGRTWQDKYSRVLRWLG